jgi:hypothetical protein
MGMQVRRKNHEGGHSQAHKTHPVSPSLRYKAQDRQIVAARIRIAVQSEDNGRGNLEAEFRLDIGTPCGTQNAWQ